MTKIIGEIKGIVGIAGTGKSDRLKSATYNAAVEYEKAENGDGDRVNALANLLEVALCEIEHARTMGRNTYADKLENAIKNLAMVAQ